MSPLAPLQKAKSTFAHWQPVAAAAATPRITGQTRHGLLPGPGQHNTGRLAERVAHTAIPPTPAGPSQGSAGLHLRRAACHSPEHCRAHTTPPAEDPCLGSRQVCSSLGTRLQLS